MQKIPRKEQETIILYDNDTGEWEFYSDCPKHIRKWGDKVPNPRRQEYYEDGTEAVLQGVIEGSVSIRAKPKLTKQQREDLAGRMGKIRPKS